MHEVKYRLEGESSKRVAKIEDVKERGGRGEAAGQIWEIRSENSEEEDKEQKEKNQN